MPISRRLSTKRNGVAYPLSLGGLRQVYRRSCASPQIDSCDSMNRCLTTCCRVLSNRRSDCAPDDPHRPAPECSETNRRVVIAADKPDVELASLNVRRPKCRPQVYDDSGWPATRIARM